MVTLSPRYRRRRLLQHPERGHSRRLSGRHHRRDARVLRDGPRGGGDRRPRNGRGAAGALRCRSRDRCCDEPHGVSRPDQRRFCPRYGPDAHGGAAHRRRGRGHYIAPRLQGAHDGRHPAARYGGPGVGDGTRAVQGARDWQQLDRAHGGTPRLE